MKAPRQVAKTAATIPAQHVGKSAQSIVDNRPQAVAQRQMQEVIANSPRMVAQRQVAEAINNSPRMVAQQQAAAQLQAQPNRTGLPDKLKAGVESLSGHSLDDVRVHYNSAKPAQLQAHAYAQGSEIHVGPGQEKYLPHEAWHVVQQKQGRVQATTQLKGVGVNDDSALEREADVMGGRAAKRTAGESGNKEQKNQLPLIPHINRSGAQPHAPSQLQTISKAVTQFGGVSSKDNTNRFGEQPQDRELLNNKIRQLEAQLEQEKKINQEAAQRRAEEKAAQREEEKVKAQKDHTTQKIGAASMLLNIGGATVVGGNAIKTEAQLNSAQESGRKAGTRHTFRPSARSSSINKKGVISTVVGSGMQGAADAKQGNSLQAVLSLVQGASALGSLSTNSKTKMVSLLAVGGAGLLREALKTKQTSDNLSEKKEK